MKKLLIVILLFTGCKSAEQLYNKAKDKDAVKVAGLARADWPCTTTKQDTTIRTDTVFDIVEVRCPDTVAYRVDSFETIEAVKVPVYIKVKMPQEVKTVTIVKQVEDSAKIFILQAQAAKDGQIIEKLNGTIKTRGTVIKWLIFLLIGLSIPYIIKLIRLWK